MTAFLNQKEKTISVLYGDSAAFESASSNFQRLTGKEHFVLITYHLKNFYYDYDAQARGSIELVEYISNLDPSNISRSSYQITAGDYPRDSAGNRCTVSDRIKFIFLHKAYNYPDVDPLNR